MSKSPRRKGEWPTFNFDAPAPGENIAVHGRQITTRTVLDKDGNTVMESTSITDANGDQVNYQTFG